MPERIQLSRRKGWRMPENTTSVARPTKWGNPFRIGEYGPDTVDTAREAVDLFRTWITRPYPKDDLDIAELRGKNLACWCKLDQPCHADVLLELANRDDAS